MSKTPSMDEKHIPSPPNRTTEQYEADKAAGINWNSWNTMPEYPQHAERDRKMADEPAAGKPVPPPTGPA